MVSNEDVKYLLSEKDNELLSDSDILKYASIGLSAFTAFIFIIFYCLLSRSVSPLFYLVIFSLVISYSLKPEITCSYCDLAVSSNKELNTHLLTCKQKQILSLKEEIKNIRHKKDKKYKELNNKVKNFETELLEIKSKLNIKLVDNEGEIKKDDIVELEIVPTSVIIDNYDDEDLEDGYSKV